VINEDAPVIFGISYCYNLLAIIPDIASAVITTTYFAVGMTTMPAMSMVHDIILVLCMGMDLQSWWKWREAMARNEHHRQTD
jgi:hypothetical protein